MGFSHLHTKFVSKTISPYNPGSLSVVFFVVVCFVFKQIIRI